LTTFAFNYVSAAQPPTARIVSIDYPTHVLSQSTFPVTVVVDYSDKVGVDVGIWDVHTGDILQSISIALQNTGEIPFTFNLTSPQGTAEWQLLAVARIWWQDAWYQDPLEGSKPVTIRVSSNATVELASQTASSLTFDGVRYSINASTPLTLSAKPGLHSLEVSPLAQSGPGERYVFAGWSDGVDTNPRQIVITGNDNLTAAYRTEYYLSVKSSRGPVSGEGWYPAGSTALLAVVPTSRAFSWFDLVEENYAFSGWSGDSNSTELLTPIIMNGPKNVDTAWILSGVTANLTACANLFLLGSAVLAVWGILCCLRRRRSLSHLHPFGRRLRLVLPLLILVVALIPTSLAHAELPVQSGVSIERIGDASWYYWNNTASDTCLLWLGGGTTNEQILGYYSYEINPYQYESFGTIRFIQDLAKHYCVIALQEGSYASFSPNSNRTIHEEPYQMESTIIGEVRDWIRQQGYAHVFLVGYSTGAQVAAMEVSVRAPQEWISPDGLVLITPRLSEFVSQNAYRIHASLLVLYGESIETPAYVSTGHEFYINAPQNGQYDSHYQLKEFDVVEGTGHEVWTIFNTGAYDTHALRIIVNFIDEVRSLQFTQQEVARIANDAQNPPANADTSLQLTYAAAPNEIWPSDLLRIQVRFSYNFKSATETDIVVLDSMRYRIVNDATFLLNADGYRIAYLDIFLSSNFSEPSFSIIALRNSSSGWQMMGRPLSTSTRIRQDANVTVVSTFPSMTIVFDGSQFNTSENGIIHLETKLGQHTLQIDPVTYLGSVTRIVFVDWGDGSDEASRELNVDNDTVLYLNCRLQYFVNASSPYGQVAGSGWRDADSVATIAVSPPLLNVPGVIFTHWMGDASSNETRSLLTMNSPKTVQADWTPVSEESNEPYTVIWLISTIALFIVTLSWNLKLGKRTKFDQQAD
jgi:hypothetical protein